jgi:hypothetical protein
MEVENDTCKGTRRNGHRGKRHQRACRIWLFVSPWVYGVAGDRNAWNSWIVGVLIAVFALIQ